MYSGLLPKGLTEDDLSPDDEVDEEGDVSDKERCTKGDSGELMKNPTVTSVTEANRSSEMCEIPGISQEIWNKFQELRKRKEESKTTNTREKRRRRRRKKNNGAVDEKSSETSKELKEDQEKHWNELKQHFDVNDRFQLPPCFRPPPKSGLEKNIEKAIAEGDIAKAEEMSDRLATRELAVKIAQAADCRDYLQRKQEEESLKAAQKRKNQIAWGFEAKKRWETKSNMGFM